jgi:succinate-acetate transporter protein
VADPSPLGLSALALTTFLFGLVTIGVGMGGGGARLILSLALIYGGLAQLLAGMWEFRQGNTLGATWFASIGAFWLSYVVFLTPGIFGMTSAAVSNQAHGYFLIGWAIVTAILAIASFRTTGALAATLVLLFLTLLLLGLGALTGTTSLTTIGGWLAILTALVAWYTALATLLRTTSRGAIVLPVYPLA